MLTAASLASARQIDVASPRDGATLSRTATFTPRLTKSLKKQTARVEVWVDSKRLAVDGKAPFRPRLDTTKLDDGAHTFSVRVIVRKGRKASVARAKTYSRTVSAVVSNAGRAKGGKGGSSGSGTKTTTTTPTTPAQTADPTVASISNGSAGWNKIFDDEFDGTSLDGSKWNNQRDDWLKGGVAYNNLEDDYYMPSNTTVSGGSLVQTIRKEKTIDGHNYTTGMVNSNKRFAFTYGYVEARMKVPSCDGCWPAFWMLPSKTGWPPEIDIFEFFDSDTLKVPYFSSHWKVPTADQEYVTNPFGIWGSDYTQQWHTYGMLWTPDSVQVFLDGVAGPKYTDKAVPHEDMYLIIQAALGKGYNTPDGANLQTDYVRVFQQPKAG
ncbi:MAG: family 16 glycosylhydrolase [Solirubrobacterales bacterium]